jgi:hypothetical protein
VSDLADLDDDLHGLDYPGFRDDAPESRPPVEVDDDPGAVLGAIILDAIADLTAKVDAIAGKVDALETEARPILESMKGTAEKMAEGGILGLFR